METSTTNLAAAAETDLPPQTWAVLTAAVAEMASKLFPNSTVALRVMDDAAIRRLNCDFLGVDAATDVLSFPADNTYPADHAGDIALSWESAVRQAKVNNHTAEAEAVELLAHGLLHLAGLDHGTASARRRMEARTADLLDYVSQRGAGCEIISSEVDAFGR